MQLEKTSTVNKAEKLQHAVAQAIAAGYQLDREAFEFLSELASTEDPTETINKALAALNSLEKKPFFICKELLVDLLKEPALSKEISPPPLQETTVFAESQLTESKSTYRPYAKEVAAETKIIDDPCSKLGSDGAVEDYVEYFRDRFRRLEKLLRQRIDVKGAASIIDAIKASSGTRSKIIGMITEKRESQQRTIITLEDQSASVTVLIPQSTSEEVKKKARALLLDQVICVSVTKTRGSLLIAEDIILPDIAQKQPHKADEPVYAVLTSDLHVGSTKFQKEALSRFLLWLNGKYGNENWREIASHVKYVLIAGDIVDGVGVYPNQVKELVVRDLYKQYRLAAKYIEQIPDYIEVIIIPGNHDSPRRALPQPAIANEFLETLQETRNVRSLGSPCYLSIHGVEVLMFHGRSLDDVISAVPGMSHNNPEKAMRLLLQSRHLAPIYGGKTPLSPETSDFLVIERVPDIFHGGHIHSLEHGMYRGVLIVNSGCWQEQTSYMKRNGFMPTPNKVPIVNLQTLEPMHLAFS
ncbi:DNA-directed DNA polymerase II small subunit [Candidatus Bathyarchaeota archaeon]|nr:DNA-directed DNA polymerase II small subunit [Candidatus Bathyarchaeota archaeon]